MHTAPSARAKTLKEFGNQLHLGFSPRTSPRFRGICLHGSCGDSRWRRRGTGSRHQIQTSEGCVPQAGLRTTSKASFKSKRAGCWSLDCRAAPAEVSEPALLWLLSSTPCSAASRRTTANSYARGGMNAVGARAVTSRCARKERACVDQPQNQCGEDRCSRRAACDLMLLRVRLRELAVLPSPPPTVAAIGNRWPPSRCSCAFVLDMRRPSRRMRRRRAAGLDLVRQPQRRGGRRRGRGA